jgi:gluconokinase
MTVLVLDIGSSSTRALLFDDEAQPIPGAAVSQPHHLTTTPPGAGTMEAEALQKRVEHCIDTVMQHPAAKQIQWVGMATFVGNVMGVDQSGNARTVIYTYADTRSAEDVEALKAVLDSEKIHQRTGCMLHTAYQAGRLRWLRRTEPELFARVSRWVDFAAYLYGRWFGDSPASYSAASWSGMLNRKTLDWDAELLQALDIDQTRLPALADYSDGRTGLLPAYAERWPALRDARFFLAVGDGAAANIGSGCADASHMALTVGTTAALRMVTDELLPRVPDGLWCYQIDRDHHLIGGATSEGGSIFDWARHTLRLGESIEAELAGREPDAHGLTFLPLLAGERSPGWATDATGSIAGLRLSTTPLDIMQAALEGVALRLSLIADQLAPLTAPDVTIVAGGGALVASPAWAQMIANALNRAIHVTEDGEITARGVAVLALYAAHQRDWIAFPPAAARVVEPIPAQVERMRAVRERQIAQYEKLVKG